MILPKKQLSLSESYFGFGAFLLQQLDQPRSIDALWECYKEIYVARKYKVKFSFDQYILALDYLFIIGAIQVNGEGVLSYEAA